MSSIFFFVQFSDYLCYIYSPFFIIFLLYFNVIPTSIFRMQCILYFIFYVTSLLLFLAMWLPNPHSKIIIRRFYILFIPSRTRGFVTLKHTIKTTHWTYGLTRPYKGLSLVVVLLRGIEESDNHIYNSDYPLRW